MKKIRIGFVGMGHRGRYMLSLTGNSFKNECEVVAACDISSACWEERQTFPVVEPSPMKTRFPDVRFYNDFYRMLDEAALDALVVETPADNHAKFCAEGLNRNIAIFSDIPSVADLEEAKMLWDCAGKSKGMFMTGANPNEWGFIEALYDLYKKGMLGKPYYLEAEYIHDIRAYFEVTPWRKTRMPISYCTHSLGPLLRVLEEELRTVSSVTTGSHINKEPGQHDAMTAHFTTDSNVVVRFTASFINNAPIGPHSYRVYGTEGYFERFSGRGKIPPATFFTSNTLYGTRHLTELPVDTPRYELGNTAGSEGHGGADYALFMHFFKALAGETEPITLRDGLRMTLPGIYACESARQGGKVLRIKYPWDSDFSTTIV